MPAKKKTKSRKAPPKIRKASAVQKVRTGIYGLDDLTFGGLPRGRSTLVAGGAGSGKTLLAMEFLARGARDDGEPGVFVTFEESGEDLAANVASLGFDLAGLRAEDKLIVEHILVDRSDFLAAGDFDLSGLFIRLEDAVRTIGAKRVALDTIETLFAGFDYHALVRSELNRLFRWLKEKNLTAIVTAEKGEGTLTRHGLEDTLGLRPLSRSSDYR